MLDKLKTELVKAMKNKDKERVSVLRLMNVKLSEKVKEDGGKADLVAVLDSMIKERMKTIETVKETRPDMAEAEQYEINVISEFLPKRMSMEEIEPIAAKAIVNLKATSMRDMGKVIGSLKSELGDNAKPSDIAQVVKELLT